MEKSTPHCKLSRIKALIAADKVRATKTAYIGAKLLGINGMDAMCAVVNALTDAHFYKSMTTHADHHIWQDVYHITVAPDKTAYIKLTVIDDVLIVSFKEK